MQILLVTHYYSTHRGGIELVAGELAAGLSRSHQVVWAASDCDPLPDARTDSPRSGSTADARASVRFLPMRTLNAVETATGVPWPIWSAGSLLRLWREARNADVVHLHDFTYMGSSAAFLYARWLGKPVLLTQHVGFIPYKNRVLRLILRAVHATLGRLLLGRADQVVFVSPVVREYFEQFVHFSRPPLVLSNGVDTETFLPAASGGRGRARTALDLDRSRPILLFVGRFVEKKGLHVLKELARRLTDVSWAFAGWGPMDPEDWHAPHVHVFRDRRGAALVPLYQAADLLVLPSVGEGLPLVVQEAMSCGIPAMVGEDTAAAIGAPPGTVFSCGVGADGATVDAWERALRGAIEDKPRLSEMGEACAGFARARWSWQACVEKYTSLLEALRNPKNAPP